MPHKKHLALHASEVDNSDILLYCLNYEHAQNTSSFNDLYNSCLTTAAQYRSEKSLYLLIKKKFHLANITFNVVDDYINSETSFFEADISVPRAHTIALLLADNQSNTPLPLPLTNIPRDIIQKDFSTQSLHAYFALLYLYDQRIQRNNCSILSSKLFNDLSYEVKSLLNAINTRAQQAKARTKLLFQYMHYSAIFSRKKINTDWDYLPPQLQQYILCIASSPNTIRCPIATNIVSLPLKGEMLISNKNHQSSWLTNTHQLYSPLQSDKNIIYQYPYQEVVAAAKTITTAEFRAKNNPSDIINDTDINIIQKALDPYPFSFDGETDTHHTSAEQLFRQGKYKVARETIIRLTNSANSYVPE